MDILSNSLRIRAENSGSVAECRAIRVVHETAFGGLYEADLVDALRGGEDWLVSLVAECERGVVGHILFSRMWIESASGLVSAVALAPVAVLPEWQRKGVGRGLIEYGLGVLRGRGERIVIVVGHPEYYPRFGFSSDRAARLETPFPREAVMALELVDGALEGVAGGVVYPAAFGVDCGG